MPTHIDDWIEQPPTSEGERLAKDWLDEFRKPAHMADHVWLESVSLTCLYEGERYRCVGASRMGDVWLSPNLKSAIGYEIRADVDGCSGWERSDAGDPRTARVDVGAKLLLRDVTQVVERSAQRLYYAADEPERVSQVESDLQQLATRLRTALRVEGSCDDGPAQGAGDD